MRVGVKRNSDFLPFLGKQAEKIVMGPNPQPLPLTSVFLDLVESCNQDIHFH